MLKDFNPFDKSHGVSAIGVVYAHRVLNNQQKLDDVPNPYKNEVKLFFDFYNNRNNEVH